VLEYIKAGKCKMNNKGKVVLLNGLCDIPGCWLKDRVDKWHRCSPGQIVAQMMYDLLLNGAPETSMTYSS
jgi:hypothetical protein